MSADRYEFRDPKLIAEFDILPPEEGSGRKTNVAHCHHCQWKHALHAPRMKQHLENCENYKRKQAEEGRGEGAAPMVLAAENYGVDSYWKQLGFEGSELGILAAPEFDGEDTRPELSPKQKEALARSRFSAISIG
jgi:hypothetical protein